MTELLITFTQYLWIADFVTFCILGALALHQRHITSSLMTIGIVIIFSGTITNYEGMVSLFVAPSTSYEAYYLWCFGFILIDCVVAYALYLLYRNTKKWFSSPLASRLYLVFSISFLITTIIAQYGTLTIEEGGMSYKVWVILAHHLGSCIFYGLAMYVISKAHESAHATHQLIARTYILAFSVACVIQIMRVNEKYFFETHYLAEFYRWGFVSINISTTGVAMMVALLGVYQYFTETKRKGWLWTL